MSSSAAASPRLPSLPISSAAWGVAKAQRSPTWKCLAGPGPPDRPELVALPSQEDRFPTRARLPRQLRAPHLVGEPLSGRVLELVVRVDAADRDLEVPLVVGHEHVDPVDSAGSLLEHALRAARDVGDHCGLVVGLERV